MKYIYTIERLKNKKGEASFAFSKMVVIRETIKYIYAKNNVCSAKFSKKRKSETSFKNDFGKQIVPYENYRYLLNRDIELKISYHEDCIKSLKDSILPEQEVTE